MKLKPVFRTPLAAIARRGDRIVPNRRVPAADPPEPDPPAPPEPEPEE